MIEPIDDMPPGTIGLRAVGSLEAADFADGIGAPLAAIAARGDAIRLVLELPAADFARIDPFSLAGAARAGLERDLRHSPAWTRTAVVSDVGWVRQGLAMAGGMLPGEVRAFGGHELEAAKAWVAG